MTGLFFSFGDRRKVNSMDDKTRWLKTYIDLIKGNALWSLTLWIAGSILTGLLGTKLFNQTLVKGAQAAGILIGVYFMIRAFVKTGKDPMNEIPIMAIELLKVECDNLLQKYKELDFNSREECRLPLAHSSWPAFNKPWSYVQYSLCSQSHRMRDFQTKSRFIWQHMRKRDDLALFRLDESSLMYQVIDALTEFHTRLQELHPISDSIQ
jgi:hypothetical protein